MAVALQHSVVQKLVDDLLDKERIALRLGHQQRLERGHFARIAEQRAQQFVRALGVQRFEAQQRIITSVAPFVPVFRSIIHQQENPLRGDGVGEQIEQAPGRAIDPVQVFENHHHRLDAALSHNHAPYCFERQPPPGLRVHLVRRDAGFGHAQQRQQESSIRLQGRVECFQLTNDLRAAGVRVVFHGCREVVLEHLDDRQKRSPPCHAKSSNPP
jgi:hypothetical protein